MSVIADAQRYFEAIGSAVSYALSNPMQEALLREIKEKAKENVYEAYTPTEWAMSTRRGHLGDRPNLEVEFGGSGDQQYLRITNMTTLQHASTAETSVVETGNASFRQPFPRPFMDEALDEYVGSGRAESDLKSVLASYGII